MILSACGRNERHAEEISVNGMEKSVGLVFEDLTKMGFCAIQDAPIQCVSHAAGIDTITLHAENRRIETVEFLVNLGQDRESQYIENSKQNLTRLAKYFNQSSINREEWISNAVDHSRVTDCPIMIEVGGLSIITERLTPQTLVGDFEKFTMTRTQNIRNGSIPLSYKDECDYNTGRYKREEDNPPEVDYLDGSKQPGTASY
jgi:hypothetical protein